MLAGNFTSLITVSKQLRSRLIRKIKFRIFPGYKDSPDLVRRVKAMEMHFKTFKHFYNITEIADKCIVHLKLDNLAEDDELPDKWPDLYDELVHSSTRTLACVGLAMHNVVVKLHTEENFQHQKIYTR